MVSVRFAFLMALLPLMLLVLYSTSTMPAPEVACAEASVPFPGPARPTVDFAAGDRAYIRIFKQEKTLELWRVREGRYALYRAFPVYHFSGALGPKLREGDRQAPEGFYGFSRSALNPNSRYHRSFDVGFPNAYDRLQGRAGSFIMVHGGTASTGCFAMTDPQIDEIYNICAACFASGQPFIRIHIFPFRMTEEKMRAHADSPWRGFWTNLKEGYDFFSRHSREPEVFVRNGRYAFE